MSLGYTADSYGHTDTREKLIVVIGPTAVGKTSVALSLARRLNGEIISGDSMSVYKGLDIGTAKPSMEERSEVPHHLIDVLSPEERFSAADFSERAALSISDITGRGKMPILAGGTGLYTEALLEGYSFGGSGEDPGYRSELMKIAEEKGGEALYTILREKDPVAAERIEPRNIKRVIRAIEASKSGDGGIRERHSQMGESLRYNAFVAGLRRERKELYDRINLRVEAMFRAGLMEEVRRLLNEGVSPDAPAMQGIGYKETLAFIRGEIKEEEAVERIKISTRHFAKRQMTWYRRMPYIRWYDADNISEEALTGRLLEDIGEFFGI